MSIFMKFETRRDEILKFYKICRPLAEILKFSERERIYGRGRNREKFHTPFYTAFARPKRLIERKLIRPGSISDPPARRR